MFFFALPFIFLMLNFIVFPFYLLLFAMADFIWVDEASRCFEFTDREDVQCFFSDKPALKLDQQFTGTSAKTPLTLLFSRLNAVNAASFPF